MYFNDKYIILDFYNEMNVIKVADKESGEIRYFYDIDLKENTIIERKKLQKKKEYLFNLYKKGKDKRGPYIMAMHNGFYSLESDKLSLQDRKYIMQLLPYVDFDNEPLSNNKKDLTVYDIAKIWDIHTDTARRRLNRFVNLGILHKIEHSSNKRKKVFIFDETYIRKREMLHSEKGRDMFTKVYQNKLTDVIQSLRNVEKKTGKPATNSLALLFGIIPYVHYQTGLLVFNMNDDISEKVEKKTILLNNRSERFKYLTKSKIGRILGFKKMNSQTINNYFRWLESAGAILIQRDLLKNNTKQRYIVHPELMYRENNLPTDYYWKRVINKFNDRQENSSLIVGR